MRLDPPLPLDVVVETSLGCNLRCPMCDQHQTGLTAQRRTIAPALLDQVSREVLPTAARMALSVSGEPLMSGQVGTLVTAAQRAGVRLVIASNGTVLPARDEALDRLVGQCARLAISLDSLHAPTYAEIRGADRLDVVLANLRRLARSRRRLPRRARPRLGLTVVWMRQNLDELPGLIHLAASLDLDFVSVAHLTVFGTAQDGDSLRHVPELADLRRREAIENADKKGVFVDMPPPYGTVETSPRPPVAIAWSSGHPLRRLRHHVGVWRWRRASGGAGGCPYLESAAYVSIDGKVAPCCMPGRPILGDLHERSFAQIWSGQRARDLRQRLRDGRPTGACAHCSVHRKGAYVPGDERTVRPSHGVP